MSISRTVVISCAGMGSRLGLGTTKALIEVDGLPLVIRHLQYLDNEKDIRIVVGFQAEKVINTVLKYRKDVLFVFNHEYHTTGTGASVYLASKYANDYVLSLDGDMLIHPEDMKKIMKCEYEFVGGNDVKSEDPWLLQTFMQDGKEMVSSFSRNEGSHEWNGVTQIRSDKISEGKGHVFQLLEPNLPIEYMNIRTREIDTIADYENAVEWVRNGYR